MRTTSANHGDSSSSTSELEPPPSVIADLASPGPFEGADFSLSCGDLAPDWKLESAPGRRFSFFDDYASGYTRLMLVGAHPSQDEALIGKFLEGSTRHAANGVRVCLILPSDAFVVQDQPAWVSTLIDKDQQLAVSVRCHEEGAKAIMLRGNQRIAAIVQCSTASAFPDALHDACANLQLERAPDNMLSRAPVLTVPNVFSADECRTLINVFNTRGQVLVQAGKAINYFNADYKMLAPEQGRRDRVDQFFHERPTVQFLLRRMLRVEQEIARAFHYRITKHETMRVARYQGTRIVSC